MIDSRRRGHGEAQVHQQPEQESILDLREVLGILRRRIWLVAICVVLGTAAGWYIAHRQPPVWRAKAVIRVDDPTLQMSGQLAGGPQMGYRTDPIQSTLETMTSPGTLGAIVDQEWLRVRSLSQGFPVSALQGIKVPEIAPTDTIVLRFLEDSVTARSLRSGITTGRKYGEVLVLGPVQLAVGSRPDGIAEAALLIGDRQETIGWLAGKLTTKIRASTNIVDVAFIASAPGLAQRVVNRAVNVFEERSRDMARAVSTRKREFLEGQLAQADTLMRRAQDSLSDFRNRTRTFSSEARATAQQTGLMTIEMRREELRADRQMYRMLLDGLHQAQGEQAARRLQALAATPEIASNPIVGALFTQLLGYETRRDSMTSGRWGASARNPDLQQVIQQIGVTRQRLEEALNSHMQAVDARLASIDSLRNRTANQIAGLPESEAAEARLLQQVQSMGASLESIREELYKARIAEAVEAGPVSIVDLSPLPEKPEQSKLPMLLGMGFLLGLLTGSTGAFVREILNTKIRDRSQLEVAVRARMLGAIPKLPRLANGWKGRKLIGKATNGTNGHGNGNGNGHNPELVTVKERRSHMAEAFRTLRTNLLFAEDGESVKTLVITSPAPGEGKTTTAANLAVTYAQQGLKVLLVDCDLRKPRLAELFEINRKPGLAELLVGESSWEEAIRPVAGVEGLSILPAGTLPPNPTEMLGSAVMRDLLAALREKFDVVIMDTPPLAGGADAAILGGASDGVLLVAKAGATHQQGARLAARELRAVGAKVVGAVMNDPAGELPRYGDNAYYYYQYEYYGDRDKT